MWSWQPFGPSEGGSFVAPGSHYRGFPVVKVCGECKDKAQKRKQVNFSYQGTLYTFVDGVVATCTSRSGQEDEALPQDMLDHPF